MRERIPDGGKHTGEDDSQTDRDGDSTGTDNDAIDTSRY